MKNPIEQATFEAIEAYVLDRMSAQERRAFEDRLAADPELHNEVVLAREHIHAVELGGVQRSLRDIAAEEHATERSPRTNWGRYLAYAATVAVIVAMAVWWNARPPLHERLFAAEFMPEPGLPVTMGASEADAFADAMVYYKEGRYTEARERWQPLLEREPTNDTLLFYLAMTDIATGDLAAAELRLKATAEHTSIFQQRARWYLFIVLVRSARIDEAQAMGLEQDAVYGKRARRILQQLQ
jgi:thioredoxin-like negative regulator of GroEL